MLKSKSKSNKRRNLFFLSECYEREAGAVLSYSAEGEPEKAEGVWSTRPALKQEVNLCVPPMGEGQKPSVGSPAAFPAAGLACPLHEETL